MKNGKEFYFEFLSLTLLVVLILVHVFLEFLHLCLGRRLLLPPSLDGSLHPCDGQLELCYLRAVLKQAAGPSSREDPRKDEMMNDSPGRHC